MASKGKKRFKMPAVGGRPGAGMGGGGGGLGGAGMMRQIEELQNQMAQAQAALAEAVVQGSAGGGAVVVEMSGSQELKGITIQPAVVDPEDVEMLQDLIMAAFKEAVAKAQALAQERMGPLTGGLDIPGLL